MLASVQIDSRLCSRELNYWGTSISGVLFRPAVGSARIFIAVGARSCPIKSGHCEHTSCPRSLGQSPISLALARVPGVRRRPPRGAMLANLPTHRVRNMSLGSQSDLARRYGTLPRAKLRAAVSYIEEHLEASPSLEQLAAITGISPLLLRPAVQAGHRWPEGGSEGRESIPSRPNHPHRTTPC
jgi:hypothetical protein